MQQPRQSHLGRLRGHLPAQRFVRLDLGTVRIDAGLLSLRNPLPRFGCQHTGEQASMQRDTAAVRGGPTLRDQFLDPGRGVAYLGLERF